MKKFMSLFFVLVLMLGGCSRVVPEAEPELTIYASFYPIYALVLGVTADVPDVTLKCLTQPQDGCLRNYSLSEWDAALLSTADALLIGGRGLESFESLITASALPIVTLMDGADLTGGESTVDAEAEETDHFAGLNPWLWLSPDGARAICQAAANALAKLDPRYADKYRANLAALEFKLDQLKGQMRAQGQVALMHEGLSYLVGAMGLTTAVTIRREPGSDLEPGALEDALSSLNDAAVHVVLLEEQAPGRLVNDLEAAGLTVVLIDTLTAHTSANPDTYFDAMHKNIERIQDALDLSNL